MSLENTPVARRRAGFLFAYTLPTNSRKWYVCGVFSNGGENAAKPVKYGLSMFFIVYWCRDFFSMLYCSIMTNEIFVKDRRTRR